MPRNKKKESHIRIRLKAKAQKKIVRINGDTTKLVLTKRMKINSKRKGGEGRTKNTRNEESERM